MIRSFGVKQRGNIAKDGCIQWELFHDAKVLQSGCRLNASHVSIFTKLEIVINVVVVAAYWWRICCIWCIVRLLLRWCKWWRQVGCKTKFPIREKRRRLFNRCLPAACCWAGGWRCKNGWLKKTSNGIRSLAFRRNKPKRRSWSSGVVPKGSLKGIMK